MIKNVKNTVPLLVILTEKKSLEHFTKKNCKLNTAKLAELDADKLKSVPVDLKKISDIIDKKVVKKMYIILRSMTLKTKYLVLLT